MSVPQWFAAWLIFALLLGLPPIAAAQPDSAYLGALQFPEGDRELRQNLRRAEEALREQRYDDAIGLLGELLTGKSASGEYERLLAEDWFIRERGKLTSIKTEAQRLLDSIPAKEMRQYELQHGGEAQVLLEQALKSGDAEKMAEVARRFFHTQAGYQATAALGRLHLESGQAAAAIGYLKRVVDTPAAQRHVDPDASVLLAAALLHSGDQAKVPQAKQVLLNLRERQPTFELRGAPSPSFASDDEALPWLEKIFGRPQAGKEATMLQWTGFRGNAQRNTITSFDEPTSNPRWRVPISNDPRDEELLAETRRQFLQQGTPPLPSLQLLAVRDVVLLRGPEALVGIDINTGKRIWDTRAHNSQAKQELEQREKDASRSDQLKQRIWDDAIAGQLSSDGDLVFRIEDLRDAGPYSKSPQNPFERRFTRAATNNGNKLVALSLKREGALEWESPPLEKVSPDKEPHPLTEIFFLGAPLVVDGQLYVMGEIRGEIALVVLDAKSGELKWKQQLGHVETFNVQADPLRRLAGASPSLAEGVIICPTVAGVVVAVDAMNRRLLWATPYVRSSEARAPRFDLSSIRIARFGERWLDSTATIADGKVVLTPPDAGDLICLDLTTGKAAWNAQPRGDGLFVAGVREGTIVVVGKREVNGISLADGTTKWTLEIDPPSGRGVLDEQHYYQPTSSGKTLAIDVAEGKVVREMTTSRPLGNLITYGDDILSVSDEAVSVHPRVDRLQQKIEKILSRDPNDTWALSRRGELLLHEKKWPEALAILRKAYAQPKPDSAAQGLLAQAMFHLLEQDYKQHEALAPELEKLIDDPVLADRYQRAMAIGLEAAGDRLGAFRALLAIGSKQPDGAARQADRKLIDLELNWRTRNDRWVSSRLATLYGAVPAEERAQMDQAIAAELGRLPKNAPGAIGRFVERFAFHPQADEAKLRLAGLLTASSNLLEAELLVDDVRRGSDRRLAAQSLASLANVMIAADRWEDAAAAYLHLAEHYSDVEAAPGLTGRQLRDSMQKQIQFRQAQAAITRKFPKGRVIVEPDSTPSARFGGDRRLHPIPLHQADVPYGTPPTFLAEPQQNLLRVRDSRGHDQLLVNLNRLDNRRFTTNVPGLATARLSGHLLIISTGYEVLGVDLLRRGRDPNEVIVWRHELSEGTGDSVFGSVQTRGVANPWTGARFIAADSNNRPLGITSPITSSGVCFIRHKHLVCVEPASGDTIWERSNVELGGDLFGDEEYLFHVPHGSDQAQVLRMVDGSLAGERKVVKFENRWTTNGRRVLSWSQANIGLKLSLDDAWDQKNVWTESAASGSRAWLCAPDEVAILKADGSFKIRSLKSDAVILDTQLQKEPELQQLYVLKSRDQYLVFVSIPASVGSPGTELEFAL